MAALPGVANIILARFGPGGKQSHILRISPDLVDHADTHELLSMLLDQLCMDIEHERDLKTRLHREALELRELMDLHESLAADSRFRKEPVRTPPPDTLHRTFWRKVYEDPFAGTFHYEPVEMSIAVADPETAKERRRVCESSPGEQPAGQSWRDRPPLL